MSNTRTPRKRTAAKPADAPQTGAELLGRINPRRRIEKVHVCLRADLVAEFQAADEELERLQAETSSPSNRLNPSNATEGNEAMRAQARKVRKLEDQIVDSQTEFTFQALNKDQWRALTDDHPPRKSNQMDYVVGYDRDTVLDELVRVCLLTPKFEECLDDNGDPRTDCSHESCGTWQQLLSVINPSEWAELRDTANLANSQVVEAPKSALASQVLDRRSNA